MAGVDALRLLLRSWFVVALGLMVGLLGAAAVSLNATPTYQSSSMVFVSVSPAKSVNEYVTWIKTNGQGKGTVGVPAPAST